MILLLAGLGLSCLPTIALALLAIGIFLLIVWLIVAKLIGKFWPEAAEYARWIILIALLLLVLIFVVNIYQSGWQWIC